MSSELVPVERGVVVRERDVVDGWIGSLEQVVSLATNIAHTEFVPKGLRGKPAAVTAAILYGREIGLGPIQSLQSVDVIDGRPAISAEMARALAFSAGHEIHIVESTTTRCIARGRRHGSGEWTEITWTMDDAKAAGLAGKDNYRKHPRRMLQARATAELCHLLFPDAVGGMPFTIDEARDDTDAAGQLGDGAEQPPRTARRSTRTRSAPAASQPKAAEPAPSGDDPPLPGEEGYEGPGAAPTGAEPSGEAQGEQGEGDEPAAIATRAQLQKILIAFKGLGVEDRTDRMAATSAIVSRELASSNDLTKADASIVIDTLERISSAEDPAAALSAVLTATEQAADGEQQTIDGTAQPSGQAADPDRGGA